MRKYSMQKNGKSVIDEASWEKRGNGNNKGTPRDHHL